MNQNNKKQPVAPKNPLSPDIVSQFLLNQTKELELRARELDIHKQTDNNSFEFSRLALESQAKDRDAERRHHANNRKSTYVFSGFIAALISGIIVYSLHKELTEVAMEIIKTIFYIVTGGAGGYAVGVSKSKKDKEPSDQ